MQFSNKNSKAFYFLIFSYSHILNTLYSIFSNVVQAKFDKPTETNKSEQEAIKTNKAPDNKDTTTKDKDKADRDNEEGDTENQGKDKEDQDNQGQPSKDASSVFQQIVSDAQVETLTGESSLQTSRRRYNNLNNNFLI